MLRLNLSLLAALLACSAANAQVYRCEENGRTLYTQRPCSDNAVRIDLGPNAEVAEGAREEALRREIEALREELARIQAARDTAANAPRTGRTESDLRSEQAESYSCKQAMRSYEISATVRSPDREQKRVAAYAACGMREPDGRGTTVIVR